MSQESASMSDELVQQSRAAPADHVAVDSDDHEGSSHTVEQFGIGLAIGFLLGGVAGVATNSLALGMMFGLSLGVVLGVVVMELR